MKLLAVALSLSLLAGNGFKEKHIKNARVKKAYKLKEQTVQKMLSKHDLKMDELEIHIRAFKQEEELEVWGRKKGTTSFKLIKCYPVCAASGSPGPKRKQGDRQVPEGLYHFEEWRFNPFSSFHLSLGINYPNASDKILSNKTKPGSDIYIHGACASIGCLAMTDDKIREIYIMAVEARNNGQKKIPVYIFPCKMTDKNLEPLLKSYPQHKTLWSQLKEAYNTFDKKKTLPAFKVDKKGNYTWHTNH